MFYNFSTTTTDADPGTGYFRFNNATIGSVTQIFIDLVDGASVTQTGFIDSWNDSTNPVQGTLVIQSQSISGTVVSTWNITAVTTATGYRKISVTYLSGTAPANNEACVIQFSRAGDVGGASGAFDFLPNLTPASGDWVWPHAGSMYSTLSIGVGFMRGKPIHVPTTTTFTQIGVYVDTAAGAGGVVRLGIYDSDSKGRPNNLVHDAGVVGTTTTGVKTITISQTLSAGKYWVTAVGQTAGCGLLSEVVVHTYTNPDFPYWHGNNFELSGITGALPSTWTAHTTFRGESFRVLLKR